MKKAFLLLFTLFTAISLQAQLTIHEELANFPNVNVNSKDSIAFYLHNDFNKNLTVISKTTNPVYKISPGNISINANDSIMLYVVFTPLQNIVESDVIMFVTGDSTASTVLKVTGTAKFNDLYDSFTFNLFDSELKTALTNYTANHTSYGYNSARDKMFETVDDRGGDTIECIYTGLRIKAANRTSAQNQGFNTEHTWPQSLFDQAEPMRSDLNHLFPTEDNANNKRSNYPFGIVTNSTWSVGGSKLGTNSQSLTVFEPRDITKGDIARAMMYFITRYPVNYGSFYSSYEDQICRLWNVTDPVSAYEMQRNNRIAALQGKRNPFIDHPGFVDRIYSFTSTTPRPKAPILNLSQERVLFDSTIINETANQYFYIVNTGDAPLTVSNITIDNSAFTIKSFNATIPADTFQKIELTFTPDQAANYQGNLTIISNSGFKSIDVRGTGKLSVGVDESKNIVNDYNLYQNYPNPFNSMTVIRFSLKEKQDVTIKLFDILGNEVSTIFQGEAGAGVNSVMLNAGGFSSGIYIYKIITKDFTQSKVMTLLK